MAKTTKGRRRITFTARAPGAGSVFVAGDFNGWDEEKHGMARRPDGLWQKVLMLEPGRYEYKFKVDGQWTCDSGNPIRCENVYGSRNSVIVVSPAE
jgi:1,4-alpha-glucan branching enzyme